MDKLLETTCGVLSAIALFAIMALTFFDVGGRKLLGHSIPGSLELTELLMVVVIFAAIPLVSQRGEHVTFDSLDSSLPHAVRVAQRALVHLRQKAAVELRAFLARAELTTGVELGPDGGGFRSLV